MTSGRAAAHEVGEHGPATAGHDGAGPLAGREGPARVADPGPGRGGDGVDDGLGHLRSGGAVQVGVSVAERGVGGADRFCVERSRGPCLHLWRGNALWRSERAPAQAGQLGACSGQPGSAEHPEQRLPRVARHRRDQSRPAASAGRTCGRPARQPSDTISGSAGSAVRCGARTLCTGRAPAPPAPRGQRAESPSRRATGERHAVEEASAGQQRGAGEARGRRRARREVRRPADAPARQAELELRARPRPADAPLTERRRLAINLDAALTAVDARGLRRASGRRSAHSATTTGSSGARRWRGREVHALTAEAERLLTLRESHRLNGIPQAPLEPAV